MCATRRWLACKSGAEWPGGPLRSGRVIKTFDLYDSVGASPLQLTSKSLRLCHGPRVPKLQLKEVRHLCKQRENKGQSSGKRKVDKKKWWQTFMSKRLR